VVAKHLKAAGANVTFSTVLGNDKWAEFVLQDLQKAGVEAEAIADPTRPTTNKNAIVCGGYRLLKVDTLDNRTISDRIQAQLVNQIGSIKTQCVMFCDFRHGIFNRETIPRFTAAMPANVFRVADSQVASRWGNFCDFQGGCGRARRDGGRHHLRAGRQRAGRPRRRAGQDRPGRAPRHLPGLIGQAQAAEDAHACE
jgi:pfkB family carbohydrate kinase